MPLTQRDAALTASLLALNSDYEVRQALPLNWAMLTSVFTLNLAWCPTLPLCST